MSSLDDLRKMFRGPRPVTVAAINATVAEPETSEEADETPALAAWNVGLRPTATAHPFAMFWQAPGKAKAYKGWVFRIIANTTPDSYKVRSYWGAAASEEHIIGEHLPQSKTIIQAVTRQTAQQIINKAAKERVKKGYTLIGAAGATQEFYLTPLANDGTVIF